MDLTIFVVTYNQEQYIQQCLDSIVMQNVDFEYEVIIGEDCSTDRTGTICDEYASQYPFIRVYHHSKNIGLVKNWEFVLNNCSGKYVAMIEGDDYWTNPNKLQHQYDYLETHQACHLCFYRPSIVYTNDVSIEQQQCDMSLFSHLAFRSYSRYEVYQNWSILTSTVMYRNSFVKYKFSDKIDIVDTYFFLSIMENGTADCIRLEGTAYRRTGHNYSMQETYEKRVKLYEQYKYYCTIMPDLLELSEKKKQEYLGSLIHNLDCNLTWKYRFFYMWDNKHLFFTSFFTTTLLTYMIKPFLRGLCNQ